MSKVEVLICNNCGRTIAACVDDYQDKDWCDVRDLRLEIGYTSKIVDEPVQVQICACANFLDLSTGVTMSDAEFLSLLEGEIEFRLKQRGLEVKHFQIATNRTIAINFDMYAAEANDVQKLTNGELMAKFADAYINKNVELYSEIEAEIQARGYDKLSDFHLIDRSKYGNFATLNEYMKNIIEN